MRWGPDIGSMCVGRQELGHQILEAALEYGAVLLFGGRQAGKTTTLRKIATDIKGINSAPSARHFGRVPVYVDLLRLPVDADPPLVFGLLAQRAREESQDLFGSRQRLSHGR